MFWRAFPIFPATQRNRSFCDRSRIIDLISPTITNGFPLKQRRYSILDAYSTDSTHGLTHRTRISIHVSYITDSQ